MKLFLSCCAALLVVSAPAQAGLFGKKDKAKSDTSETASAQDRTLPKGPGATNMPQADAPEAFRPATEAEVQAVLRADPLTQAAFFTHQYDRDPTNARMGLHLSNALRAMGRPGEAADAAHRVLLFAPDNVDVLLAAGRAHIAGNNAFEAVAPLKRAIDLKPRDWQAWSLLGVAYDQVKRPADAQAAWATALQVSPDNPAVLTNIAMSKAASGDFAGAEPLLRTAVAQKGATLQIRQNLALVLGLQGKMAQAEQLLREDLPPEQADANLAWLQQAMRARVAATEPTTRSWDTVKASGG